MSIKALVPVRSGSMRVKNKNIRPFAGSTLLELKIRQLLNIKILDGIIVNSNDDTMLKIAADLGCETVKRDEYYASNYISMNEVYKNMAENFDADTVLHVAVTNPLLKTETLENAIKFYFENRDKYDSVNAAHLIKEFLFRDNKPINYDLTYQPRSQDLPDIAALNTAFNIVERETVISNKSVVGSRPYIFIIDPLEGTDIDEQIDFDFAEFMYLRLNKK